MDSLNLEALLGGRKTRTSSKPKKTTRRHKGGALLPELLVDTPEDLTKYLGTIKDAVSKPEGYALEDIDKIVEVLTLALKKNLPKSETSAAPGEASASELPASASASVPENAIGGGKRKSTKPKRK